MSKALKNRADQSDALDILLLYTRPLNDKRVLDAFIPRTAIFPTLLATDRNSAVFIEDPCTDPD
jgi:hypothetical protein